MHMSMLSLCVYYNLYALNGVIRDPHPVVNLIGTQLSQHKQFYIQYASRVVNYDHKLYIVLTPGQQYSWNLTTNIESKFKCENNFYIKFNI